MKGNIVVLVPSSTADNCCSVLALKNAFVFRICSKNGKVYLKGNRAYMQLENLSTACPSQVFC